MVSERPRLRQFVSFCRLMPRGRQMKCSPRSVRPWRPSDSYNQHRLLPTTLLSRRSTCEAPFSLSLSAVSLKGDSPIHPHTCTRHTLIELQWYACPQTLPAISENLSLLSTPTKCWLSHSASPSCIVLLLH